GAWTGAARCLGLGLGLWYAGPLLVVMPAGLGVYDGGRPTSAAEAALQSVRVTAATPDDLTRSATAAVEALEAEGALSSPDVKAPLVTPRPASATRGQEATLHFDLYDDSGYSSAVVRVYADNTRTVTRSPTDALALGTHSGALQGHGPPTLPRTRRRFLTGAAHTGGERNTRC